MIIQKNREKAITKHYQTRKQDHRPLPSLTIRADQIKTTRIARSHIANSVTNLYQPLPIPTIADTARMTWHIVSDDHAPQPFERWLGSYGLLL